MKLEVEKYDKLIADKKKELDSVEKPPSDDKSESKDKDQIAHLEEQIRKFENQLQAQKLTAQKKEEDLLAKIASLETECKDF